MSPAELAHRSALVALRAEEQALAPLLEPVKQGIAVCYCWTVKTDAQVDRVQTARRALLLLVLAVPATELQVRHLLRQPLAVNRLHIPLARLDRAQPQQQPPRRPPPARRDRTRAESDRP